MGFIISEHAKKQVVTKEKAGSKLKEVLPVFLDLGAFSLSPTPFY